MNIIWPSTGLYMPFIGWLAWWYLGRKPSHAVKATPLMPQQNQRYTRWQSIFISTCLSAAACIFGDILSLRIITLMNHLTINVTLSLQAIIYVIVSLVIGLFLQSLVFRHREKHSLMRTLFFALKTEVFPVLIYQSGMLISMLLALKFVLSQQINLSLIPFWFMLQLAVVTGFIFSWPANHFLIKRGLTTIV